MIMEESRKYPNIKVGDLVTCDCHGEMALVLMIYDLDGFNRGLVLMRWLKCPKWYDWPECMHAISSLRYAETTKE